MKQFIIMFLVLVAGGKAFAGDVAVRTVPVASAPAPVVDGTIGAKEYAATFTDPKTGISVSWQADSAILYCALKSPGAGWLAIGFGSDGMNGADMLIASTGTAGRWAVDEEMGKSFYRHARIEHPRLIAGKAGLDSGKTVMEFAMPLALSNGKAISAATGLPFILAYHKDKTSLSKHTKRSSGMMILSPAQPTK